MKKIDEKSIQAVLQLLQKYNVGVQEFVAAQEMFNKLPTIDVETDKEPKAE